jgi:hypothetical protein
MPTTPLTTVKLLLGVVGLLLFGYGVRVDSTRIRWGGIAVVAVAVALRFVRPRGGSEGTGTDADSGTGGSADPRV